MLATECERDDGWLALDRSAYGVTMPRLDGHDRWEATVATTSTPLTELLQKETGARVEHMLSLLRPEHAEVIRLRFGIGREQSVDYGDMGRSLGVSPQTASKSLEKALAWLRYYRSTGKIS